MYNEGSGTKFLGHTPARKARRRVSQKLGPRTPHYKCVCVKTVSSQNIFLLKKCAANIESNGCC